MKGPKQTVYIVDGARTPFIRFTGKPNALSAVDLAVAAAKPLLERQPFEPTAIGEVIAGCVAPSPNEANIARIIALRLGCGHTVPGWTVQRNCASGLQALDCAVGDIQNGRHHLILAGGTECMSHAPLLYPPQMVEWLADLRSAKNWKEKLQVFLRCRPSFFNPVVSLMQGLIDPVVNLSMGQTAENLAYQFDISREEMDAYAVRSHRRALRAVQEELFEEIEPLFDWSGNVISVDNGIREDSSEEKLATLRPVFDRYGKVTAGNSSQITDGAAFLMLASEEAVEQYQLPVMAKIVDTAWAALDPSVMGLGPVYAIHALLEKNKLVTEDIDYWEINEAFSGQVLACLKAMGDKSWLNEHLQGSDCFGQIPIEKVNIDGGAIALGHPVGASGARLVLHLLHVLKEKKAKRAVASICIGGGQGGAMLIERVSGDQNE